MKSMKPKVYINGNITVRLGWTKNGYEVKVNGTYFHRGYDKTTAEHQFETACKLVASKED